MANRLHLPNLGFGMGLRTAHYAHILEHWPACDWFEILSENYMDTEGKPVRVLEQVVARYPIVMHGVSLSIGSTDALDKAYLDKLAALASWVKPAWISDHLCWTGIAQRNTHDLLPVPYTKAMLEHVIGRIKQVQDRLGRPLVLENPSTYLEFSASEMPEWEFIARMAERADCGLLLDANNVYVSCYNHGWDEKTYIDALPADRVVYVHLAGHEVNDTHIVDTHEGEVIDEVWALYRYIVSRTGPVSTMVEWDTNTPDFATVNAQVEKARRFAGEANAPNDLPSHARPAYLPKKKLAPAALDALVLPLQQAILSNDTASAKADEWIPAKQNFPAQAQLAVYTHAYRARLKEVLLNDLPVLAHYLGSEKFEELCGAFIEAHPSQHYNLARYVAPFPAFTRSHTITKKDGFAQALAQFETSLTLLFDAPETPVLSQGTLASMPLEKFMGAQLKPRKALALQHYSYPVNDYYTQVKEGTLPAVPAKDEEYLVIFRHQDTVWRMKLEKEEYALLQDLFADATIEQACAEMAARASGNEEQLMADFQRWFSKWMQHGLLSDIAA